MPSYADFQDSLTSKRLRDLEECLNSKQFVDLQITCGGLTFSVHRVIVSHLFKYFKTFTSADFAEAGIMKADLPDGNPALIARLLYFLYTGRYCKSAINSIGIEQFGEINDTLFFEKRREFLHSNMYALAANYDLPDLARLVCWAFREEFDVNMLVNNPTWPDLVAHMYESTPANTRDLKVVVIREIKYAQHHDPSLVDFDLLEEAVNKVPELGTDLATSLLINREHTCKECGFSQCVLVLKCLHVPKHKYADVECFRSGLTIQECCCCHGLEVFDVAEEEITTPELESGIAVRLWPPGTRSTEREPDALEEE